MLDIEEAHGKIGKYEERIGLYEAMRDDAPDSETAEYCRREISIARKMIGHIRKMIVAEEDRIAAAMFSDRDAEYKAMMEKNRKAYQRERELIESGEYEIDVQTNELKRKVKRNAEDQTEL